MKKTIYLFVSLVFFSCSMSKEELLISEYEQTLENTKTDLNLKFKKLEFVKNITWKDSLSLLKKYFDKSRKERIKYEENEIIELNKKIKNRIKYGSSYSIYEEIIKVKQKHIESFKGDCKGTYLEKTYLKIHNSNLNSDSILSKEYDVIYTIQNPLLNNVKQTIFKKYYLNSDLTKILKVNSNSIN